MAVCGRSHSDYNPISAHSPSSSSSQAEGLIGLVNGHLWTLLLHLLLPFHKHIFKKLNLHVCVCVCGHVFILCAHLQCEFNEIHVLHVCVCVCVCMCVCVCVCVSVYSRGREKGYVPFNQDDSSTMVFNFLCEECKRIFNAEVDVLMLRNARSYER